MTCGCNSVVQSAGGKRGRSRRRRGGGWFSDDTPQAQYQYDPGYGQQAQRFLSNVGQQARGYGEQVQGYLSNMMGRNEMSQQPQYSNSFLSGKSRRGGKHRGGKKSRKSKKTRKHRRH